MDGTNLIDFVDANIRAPILLAVLPTSRELCCVDFGLRELSCIGLNRQKRRLLWASEDFQFLKDWIVDDKKERYYFVLSFVDPSASEGGPEVCINLHKPAQNA